ncbi:MAG: hypothetical protein ACOX6V_02490 [Patescibacteria group bacterium]|jgi:hypothetical protein
MKKLNFLLFAIVSLLLTSCTLFSNNQTSTSNEDGLQQEQQEEQSEQTIGNSLKSIFSRGESAKCTYNEDGAEITVAIKGNKTRVYGIDYNPETEAIEEGGVINDGEWVYFWDGSTKAGIKYKISALEGLANEDTGTNEQAESWGDMEKWADEIEDDYEVNCTPQTISDSEFTPPSDIQFQDMAQLMESVKQFQDMKPSDIPSAEELEELMGGMGDLEAEE